MSNLITKNEFDSKLLFIIYLLGFIGLGVMYSASYYTSDRDLSDSTFFLKRQGLWLFIAITLFIVVSCIDFRIWEDLGFYLCIVSIVMLIMVFIPGLGKSVGTYYGRNFNRWIGIGPFQIQPSEFTKIAILIYLSSVFYKYKLDQPTRINSYFKPILITLIILLLLVLEPSFGTTIEILIIALAILFLSGFPISKLIIGGISLLPLLYLLVDKVGYRKKRIDVWLNPYQYRFEEGHQLVSSYQAFQSASWFGNPIGSGYSHKYLPYSHTDFVIAPFVEDFGFIGFLLLCGCILFFLGRAFYLVRKVKDNFGFFLGTGCILLLAVQFIMNLFVVTGLIPITGVSLPFFSYGGSSLVSVYITCGILVNITRKENLEL